MKKTLNYSKRILSFLISLIPKIKVSDVVNNLLSNLPRFYLNEDIEIAIESIRASAIKGNIYAVEKLFNVIEQGTVEVQVEAVKALEKINPPLIQDRIIEYYTLVTDTDVKIEILKLLNSRYYKSKEVINFNRGIISDNSCGVDYKIISISGLVKSKDFSFISYIFPHGELRLIEEVLIDVVEQNGIELEEFLKKQADNLNYFSDRVLGYYLSAYTLKVGRGNASIFNRILEEKDLKVINAYLNLCERGIQFSSFTKRLFRILLSFPIFDFTLRDTIEKKARKLLELIINIANSGSINDIKELTLICNVQLTNLFKNLMNSHISLSNVKSKVDFYNRFLAQLFEILLPADILADVTEYFSNENMENAPLLISTLKQFTRTSDEKKWIEACVPLFYENDERRRLQIYTILKKVNPDIKIIIGRMARILYSLAQLKAKTMVKKIEEIYRYSIDEKLKQIEAESIVALSRIKGDTVKDRVKEILTSLKKEDHILISAAIKSIPIILASDIEEIVTDDFIAELRDRDLIKLFLETLFHVNYRIPNKTLLTIINNIDIFRKYDLVDMVISLISKKSDWTIFQSLKSYMKSDRPDIVIVCVDILRGLKRRDININSELIVNLLYDFLDREKVIRDNKLYSSIVSLLMELNDDYSFRIFESIVEEHNYQLALEIVGKLPYHTIKKIFFTIVKLVETIDIEDLKKLKGYFSLLPNEFIDDKIKNYIIDGFRKYHEKSKSLFVSDKMDAERDNIPLIERPKLEFRIQYEQTKKVAVFFIDIANYTTLSSKLNLTGLMRVVNNFEKIVISTVEDFNGRIVKKMGDGILAIFNHPLNSVIAGLIIQEKIGDFSDFVPLKEKFKARIGIHSGAVIFKDSDIFGDTVNIASRLESMAEPGFILVSENVYNLTKDFIKFTEKGLLKLKGVSQPVNSYIPEDLTQELIKYLEIKSNNKNAIPRGEIREDVARKLKVIMFNPDFILPKNIKIKYDLKDIKKIFESFSKYIESFARDYLEEYEIKAWLQNKWNEILKKQKNL